MINATSGSGVQKTELTDRNLKCEFMFGLD